MSDFLPFPDKRDDIVLENTGGFAVTKDGQHYEWSNDKEYAAVQKAMNESWSSRIPAAIEKAEKLLDGKVRYYDQDLTATEVALAKALWELYPCNDGESHCCDFEPATCQALRDFCTKVESLD